MNYPLWVPNPPKPDATQPWHPETHLDIERLQLEDRPHAVSCDGRVLFASWDCLQESPNQIRDHMKHFFFTHSTASFVQGNRSVFAYVHPVDAKGEEFNEVGLCGKGVSADFISSTDIACSMSENDIKYIQFT